MAAMKKDEKLVTDPNQLLVPPPIAAKLLSISERTLWEITDPRGSIKPVRIKRLVLYSVEYLRGWVASQLGQPATEQS